MSGLSFGLLTVATIPAVHGETGLRERLAIETATFPTADRERVTQALDLASRLHATDRRQNEPYIDHLLRVAIRIISYYRVSDADVACAALLHDAVEDHAGELAPGGGQAEALTCRRCKGRLVQRTDDNLEIVRERLGVYHRTTEPLVEYYRTRPTFRTIFPQRPPLSSVSPRHDKGACCG